MFGTYSRYRICTVQRELDYTMHILPRIRLYYAEVEGTTVHKVIEGDTLFTLADSYFQGLPSPASFWWAIADFQPDPILDPTLKLSTDTYLFIPPTDLVQDFILSTPEEIGDIT